MSVNKRDYTNAPQHVKDFYYQQHSKLNYKYVLESQEKFKKSQKKLYTVKELLELLDDIIDPSDPDISESQIHHAFQTAEALRKNLNEHKLEWLPLVGLIHDIGKVALKLNNIEWFESAGDSFPLGCGFSDKVILNCGFEDNDDYQNPKYNSKLGIYQENCGFDNCLFWGHDEIMYQVLKNSNTNLPEEALYITRYHSFYSWHTCGGYDYLASKKDKEYLKYLNIFQKADLYSKSNTELYTIDKLDEDYYQNLIQKYLPHDILF